MKRVALLTPVFLALVFAALSLAATSTRISAHLTTRAEVPAPVGAKKATGAFTGSYAVEAKDVKLVWKLSFAHLTGRATAATLRMGKRGVIGTTVTVLCKRCQSGQTATTLLQKSIATALRTGQIYVSVYTAGNPAGEIRGQITVRG